MATGIIEPGQEIPSRRELANRLKINPNTAQRAYKEMEEKGLIFTEGNLPSRMTTDEKVFQTVRSELILEAVDAFVSAVKTINVPLDEVLPIIEQKYKNECNE